MAGCTSATSPDGKIYKVDRNGKGVPFFEPEAKYIWALATDAKGTLFAGTGEKGIIYKIGADGKGTPFYNTKATHATALTFDKRGNLIVGTGSPGKVLRIDPDGKAFVLLDSSFQEIRSLHVDDKGSVYVAALNGHGGSASASASIGEDRPLDRPMPEPTRTPVPSVSAEITSMSIVDVGSSAPPARPTRIAARRKALSTASHQMESGTSYGNRATIRRTTSPSTRTAPW